MTKFKEILFITNEFKNIEKKQTLSDSKKNHKAKIISWTANRKAEQEKQKKLEEDEKKRAENSGSITYEN